MKKSISAVLAIICTIVVLYIIAKERGYSIENLFKSPMVGILALVFIGVAIFVAWFTGMAVLSSKSLANSKGETTYESMHPVTAAIVATFVGGVLWAIVLNIAHALVGNNPTPYEPYKE
jgi:hypothetical protein